LRAAIRADANGSGYLFLNNFQDHADVPTKPNIQITVRTATDEELHFPAKGQFNLLTSAQCILPFNMDLGAIRLKQAGAQLLTSRKDPEGHEHFFFFAPTGMSTPHYLFAGAVEIEGPVASERKGTDTLVTVPANQRSSILVKSEVSATRITTLTDAESLQFWQDRCAERQVTLLTKAGVIFHKDGFELYQLGDSHFRFSLLTDGHSLPKSNTPLTMGETRDGFTELEAIVPTWTNSLKLTELKVGKTHVTFPEGGFELIHDLFLRIRYRGDTGMAFLNGRMIHDNFNADNPWEIGLRQFLPEAAADGLVLRVVPKPAEGGSCTQDAMGAGYVTGGDFRDIGIGSVEALPEYRLRLWY
jgi:hypothetical protein